MRTDELTGWDFFVTRYGSWYTSADQSYVGLAVVRPGDDVSGTPTDTLDHLDPAALAEAGRVVAHYLMVLCNR